MTDLTERLIRIATTKSFCAGDVYRWQKDVLQAAATLETLTQENARLREALEDCTEELGNEILARYSGMLDHPAMKQRYDRDMNSVYAARQILTQGDIA